MTSAINIAIKILGNAWKNSCNVFPFLRKLDTKNLSRLNINPAQSKDKRIEAKLSWKIS
jgi:hypothetical protein